AYLIELALEGACLSFEPEGEPVDRKLLERLSQDYLALDEVMKRLTRCHDSIILDAMSALPALERTELCNRDAVEQWFRDLEHELSRQGKERRYTARVEYTSDGFRGLVCSLIYGLESVEEFAQGFFISNEYKKLVLLNKQLGIPLSKGAYIQSGERRQAVSNFKRAFDWLLAEIRRGAQIQRYKGLGEMNPEQLWETTMNIEVRSLLQVQIEDVVAADEIFTTLMGDQVEPRREFIEMNALAVANLDT
ncbi:MAG: DNA gyrase subunit B, partial [Nitrososphaera sp.]